MKRDVCSAFGNNVRVNLILCLAKRAKNVSELISICGLAQSAVSQHLRKLKSCGIVVSHKEGKEVWYSLAYKKAADIAALIQSLQKEVL